MQLSTLRAHSSIGRASGITLLVVVIDSSDGATLMVCVLPDVPTEVAVRYAFCSLRYPCGLPEYEPLFHAALLFAMTFMRLRNDGQPIVNFNVTIASSERDTKAWHASI